MMRQKLLQRIVAFVIRQGTLILCRIERAPLGQVPKHGPLILVTNHIGSLEVPLLFVHLQPRPIFGFAKIETWDDPFMGWLFDLWNAIPIRRGEADMDALRKGLAVLEEGNILAIAPEGTRSRHGRLLRGHPGVVMIALHSGAPILPLAHWGAEGFSSNIKHWKRTDFHIRVGKPFFLDARGKKVTREIRQQMTDEIMVQIAGLMPEEYRGEYANVWKTTSEYIKPG